jgi:ubiquinone/menaquinone biosynthesis C-methylase UbiE
MASESNRKRRQTQQHQLLERGTSDHYIDTALYDFEYKEQEQDIDWYRGIADERAQRRDILELGAGTGRITIPLAKAGHEVWALDRMRSMLDSLEAKYEALEGPVGDVTTLEGDMREIPLEDASVGMVLAPFNCLMHLYTWQDLLACFREVHRVLQPGGTFAFDVLLPDLDWLQWDPNKRHAVTRFVHPATGSRMIYSTNHEYDHETQVCHIRVYYDDALRGRFRPRGKPKKLVHLAHRQIFPEEARALLAWAGFELEAHTGDFLGLSLNQDVESQVFVCTKGPRRRNRRR